MPEDKLLGFYNTLKESGSVEGLPSDYGKFKTGLSNPENAEGFFNALKESGSVEGLPKDYNTFANALGLSKGEPTVQSVMQGYGGLGKPSVNPPSASGLAIQQNGGAMPPAQVSPSGESPSLDGGSTSPEQPQNPQFGFESVVENIGEPMTPRPQSEAEKLGQAARGGVKGQFDRVPKGLEYQEAQKEIEKSPNKSITYLTPEELATQKTLRSEETLSNKVANAPRNSNIPSAKVMAETTPEKLAEGRLRIMQREASRKEFEEKAKKGNFLGMIQNSLVEGYTSTVDNTSDFVLYLLSLGDIGVAPDYVAATNQEKAKMFSQALDDVHIKKTLDKQLKTTSTTDEYIQKRTEEGGAIMEGIVGLAGSAYPMLTPNQSGFFINGFVDAKKEIQEEMPDLSPWKVTAYAFTQGAVQVALEKAGLSNLAKNKSVTRALSGKVMDAMKTTLGKFSAKEADVFATKAVNGFFAEAETGATQYAVQEGIRQLADALEGDDDKFEFEGSEAFLSNMMKAGLSEGVGGAVMKTVSEIPSLIKSPAKRKEAQEKNAESEQLAKDFENPNVSLEAKKAIGTQIDSNSEAVAKSYAEDLAKYESLPKESKDELNSLHEDILSHEAVLNDPNVSPETKAISEQRIQELEEQGEGILDSAPAPKPTAPVSEAQPTEAAPQEKGEFSIQGTFRGLTHVLGDPANMIPDFRNTGFIDKPTFSESVQKGKKFFTLSIPQADDVYRRGYLSVSLVFPETTTKTIDDVKAALEAKVAEAKAVIATARDKGSNAEAYLKNRVSSEYTEQAQPTPATEAQAPVAEEAKLEEEAEQTLPPEIDSLDDNEFVTIKYESLDDIPESLRDKANKFGGQEVKFRKSILGIPIGKESTSKTKEGYSVTAYGSDIKEAARQTLASKTNQPNTQSNDDLEAKKADIEKRRSEESRRMTYDEFLEELPNNSLALISNKELLSDATFRVVGSTSKEQSDNGKPQIDISYQKPDGTYQVFSTNVSEKTAERFKDANWNEDDINAKYDAELADLESKNKQLKTKYDEGQSGNRSEANGSQEGTAEGESGNGKENATQNEEVSQGAENAPSLPKKVFHATTATFEGLPTKGVEAKTAAFNEPSGVYYSVSEEGAKQATGKAEGQRVVEAEFTPKNPLVIEDALTDETYNAAYEQAQNQVREELGDEEYQIREEAEDVGLGQKVSEAFSKILIDQGYDSVVNNGNGDVIVLDESVVAESKTKAREVEVSPLQAAKESISKRVKGDKFLDVQDLLDELSDNKAEIDNDGMVTVYHRTTPENKKEIESTGKMKGLEDGVFFSTKETGQNEGYGDSIVKLKVPIESIEIDDTFGDEAHVRIPTKKAGQIIDVKEYLPSPTTAATPTSEQAPQAAEEVVAKVNAEDVKNTAKALEKIGNIDKFKKLLKSFSINDVKQFFHASGKKRKGKLYKGIAPQFGEGVYFSTNKDLVVDEFGDNVTEVALTLKNPVFTNTKEWKAVERKALELADEDYGKKNGLKLEEGETYFRYDKDNTSDVDEINPIFISKAAEQLGYDAIIDKNSNVYDNEISVLDDSRIVYEEDMPMAIAEEYHAAKADGSNPELVKAVEELLAPKESINPTKTEVKAEVKVKKEPTPEQVKRQGLRSLMEDIADWNGMGKKWKQSNAAALRYSEIRKKAGEYGLSLSRTMTSSKGASIKATDAKGKEVKLASIKKIADEGKTLWTNDNYSAQEGDGKLEFYDNNGDQIDARSKEYGKAYTEYIKSNAYAFTGNNEAISIEDIFANASDEFSAMDKFADKVIENGNAFEIAENFDVIKNVDANNSSEENINPEWAIGQAVSGISEADFNKYFDRNWLPKNSTWISKGKQGLSLDTSIQEMLGMPEYAQYFGNADEQDALNMIGDIIQAYPSGVNSIPKGSQTEYVKRAQENFKEITGIELNDRTAAEFNALGVELANGNLDAEVYWNNLTDEQKQELTDEQDRIFSEGKRANLATKEIPSEIADVKGISGEVSAKAQEVIAAMDATYESKGQNFKSKKAKMESTYGEEAKKAIDINRNFEKYYEAMRELGIIIDKEC